MTNGSGKKHGTTQRPKSEAKKGNDTKEKQK